jgi:hypothetical protein
MRTGTFFQALCAGESSSYKASGAGFKAKLCSNCTESKQTRMPSACVWRIFLGDSGQR